MTGDLEVDVRKQNGKFILWAAALTLAVSVAAVLLSKLSHSANHARLLRQFAAFIAAFGGWIGIALIGICAVGALFVFDALMPGADTTDGAPNRK